MVHLFMCHPVDVSVRCRMTVSCVDRLLCCAVSVEMAVNTKREVKPIQNIVATIYGQKDSGLCVSVLSSH